MTLILPPNDRVEQKPEGLQSEDAERPHSPTEDPSPAQRGLPLERLVRAVFVARQVARAEAQLGRSRRALAARRERPESVDERLARSTAL